MQDRRRHQTPRLIRKKISFFANASKYGIVIYSLDVKAAIWRSFSDFVL